MFIPIASAKCPLSNSFILHPNLLLAAKPEIFFFLRFVLGYSEHLVKVRER